MKLACDVCGEGEALVFCCADEAALCDACDRRVHWANKLASKHRRLALRYPSAQSHPLCDICKEKRAFLFCQEDRAILCRDCDAPIHGANHLTMKHNRFLLTSIRLAAAKEEDEGESSANRATAKIEQSEGTKMALDTAGTVDAASCITNSVKESFSTTAESGSSISDYLTKMCPGWHVEDLLDTDAMDGASKVDESLPFLQFDLHDGDGLEAICAPRVPQFPTPGRPAAASAGAAHHQQWIGGKEVGINSELGIRQGREQWKDAATFTVPQISSVPVPKKRPRHSVWLDRLSS